MFAEQILGEIKLSFSDGGLGPEDGAGEIVYGVQAAPRIQVQGNLIYKQRQDRLLSLWLVDRCGVDNFLAKIEPAGGYTMLPKTEIPGVGYHVYCQDREGNLFGIIEARHTPIGNDSSHEGNISL